VALRKDGPEKSTKGVETLFSSPNEPTCGFSTPLLSCFVRDQNTEVPLPWLGKLELQGLNIEFD
jgi:hypothetical protein